MAGQLTFRRGTNTLGPRHAYDVFKDGERIGRVWHVTMYRNAEFWRVADTDGHLSPFAFDTRRQAASYLARTRKGVQ